MIPTPFLLGLVATLELVSLFLALRARRRERVLVGRVIESDERDGSLRLAGSLVLLGVGVAAVGFGSRALLPYVPLVLLAIAVNQLRPDTTDRVTGSSGVRVGWSSRSYDELEEWRLTGDHLRLRLFGQWTAVPLARDRQEPVRALLLERAGDRESAFNQ